MKVPQFSWLSPLPALLPGLLPLLGALPRGTSSSAAASAAWHLTATTRCQQGLTPSDAGYHRTVKLPDAYAVAARAAEFLSPLCPRLALLSVLTL